MTDLKKTSTPKSPDIEGLKHFAASVDREPPFRFAGRTDELDVFQLALDDLWERWRTGKPGKQAPWMGQTFLFQGAPGAGKTAMLEQLGLAQASTPEVDLQENLPPKTPVRVCDLDPEDLECPAEMKRKIARTFFPGLDKDKELDGRETSGKSGGAGFNLGPLTIQWITGKSKELPASVWEDIEDNIRNLPWGHEPVLVMVDEVQNLSDLARYGLNWLHKGKHGLPVIPVFGGLAWAEDRLDELLLSRLSDGRVYTLDRLSEAECGQILDAFYKRFRVSGVAEAGEQWKALLCERSHGWPQHFHVGMKALAGGLARAGGNLAEAMKTEREAILEDEEKRRYQYYDRRTRSSRLHGKEILAATAIRHIPSETSILKDDLADIVEDIHKTAGSPPSRSLRLPGSLSEDEFVKDMIKSGILHEYRPVSESGKSMPIHVRVPIPSFRTYLLEVLKEWESLQNHSGKAAAPSSDDSESSAASLLGLGM